MYSQIILGALFAPMALAATMDIDVGEKGFVFDPDTVTAAVGDVLNFHFYPGDHSVASSDFANPCSPAAQNPVWSGFINPSGSGEASTMFSLTVNSTDPMWFYCAQVGHCAAGMAMVVNPPASGNTLAQYKSAASGKQGVAPQTVSGGLLVPNVDTDDDDNSSSSSSSGSSSPTAAASGNSTSTKTASVTNTAAATSASGSANAAATSNAAASFGAMNMEWSVFGAVMLPAAAWALS